MQSTKKLRHKLDSRKRVFALAITSAMFATSCVAFLHPVGQWSEPVDLNLQSDSLQGVSVKARCLTSSGSDRTQTPPCRQFARAFAVLGAEIFVSDNEEEEFFRIDADVIVPIKTTRRRPDIVITLRDGERTTGLCGWSLISMFYTFGVVPCVAEAASQATLIVESREATRREEYPLKIETRRYVGVGALAVMGMSSAQPSRTQYHRQLARNFDRFVQNKAYSMVMSQGDP